MVYMQSEENRGKWNELIRENGYKRLLEMVYDYLSDDILDAMIGEFTEKEEE